MGSLRVGHNSDFIFSFHLHALEKEMATRVSWSPLSGLKGVQPPLPFGPIGLKGEWPLLSTLRYKEEYSFRANNLPPRF